MDCSYEDSVCKEREFKVNNQWRRICCDYNYWWATVSFNSFSPVVIGFDLVRFLVELDTGSTLVCSAHHLYFANSLFFVNVDRRLSFWYAVSSYTTNANFE